MVSAANADRTAKTTSRGYFEFKNLLLGINTIKFSKVMFMDAAQAVGIVKGERVQLIFTLQKTVSKSYAT